MKQTLLFLLLCTGIANAQLINFPDPNLKTALINSTFVMDLNDNFLTSPDVDFDGEIDFDEALQIGTIIVENGNISDLSGMEFFTNLKTFSCADNQITTVDPLANLISLQILSIQNNQVTSVDLSAGFSLLTDFTFSGNAVTYLDLSGCSSLTYINTLDLNNINYFNIQGCSSIPTINITSSVLSFFDFTGCTGLNNLTVWNSQLNALDFSNLNCQFITLQDNNLVTTMTFNNNPNLSSLSVFGSPITTLDVSSLTALNSFWCANHPLLETIFAKNGANESFTLGNNPNLSFICADDAQVASVQTYLNANGLSNIVCNSYCDFTPGDNYNTITGNMKFDSNNNGCDASDITPNNIRVNISDGTSTGASYLNNAGGYVFYTQAGNFTIAPSVENPTWFNFSPATATIPFADNNNNSATQDFCITPNGIHPDIEVVISPVFFARPGFDATYQITFRNKGNQTFSEGLVGLQYNDAVLDFVSASQATFSQAVGNINWQYTNLLPFESRTITVTLNVNSPTETPAVNIGDLLNFVVSTFPLGADENPIDNTFEYTQTVVGSYDPNDITCLEGDVVPATEIGNYLHYAINFENTGNFPAENVVVKIEVDPTKFDIGSLQLMNSNFPVNARIAGNKVEFIFENIQLSIGGHGHILLKIKTQSALVTGDVVANRGDIFFDYNFPIDTGLANTVFQTLSNSVFEIDSSIAIYPNPAVNEVTITADNKIKSIQLYDAQGRIILTRLTDDLASKLEVSSYSKGIYFIKITTEKGAQVQKLLKD